MTTITSTITRTIVETTTITAVVVMTTSPSGPFAGEGWTAFEKVVIVLGSLGSAISGIAAIEKFVRWCGDRIWGRRRSNAADLEAASDELVVRSPVVRTPSPGAPALSLHRTTPISEFRLGVGTALDEVHGRGPWPRSRVVSAANSGD